MKVIKRKSVTGVHSVSHCFYHQCSLHSADAHTHTLCAARLRPLAINDFVDKPKSKLGVKLVCDVTSMVSASQSSSQSHTRAYFMGKKMGDGDRKKKNEHGPHHFSYFLFPFSQPNRWCHSRDTKKTKKLLEMVKDTSMALKPLVRYMALYTNTHHEREFTIN